MKSILFPAIFTLGLIGCASAPKDIAATYVSPNEYSGLTCEELSDEMKDLSTRVATLTGKLDEEANADNIQMGVGLVLFWPALLFLEGGDGPQAAEYALLKGKYEAAETKFNRNKCKNYVEEVTS
ncbi:hypothetical protein AAD001_17025 [Colwelliaceae bacterium 6471]